MSDFWRSVLGRGDKVEVAKSGDNYYSTIKHQGEVIMSIIQPPKSYDGTIGVGGQVSMF
jgi:hypothetical protein